MCFEKKSSLYQLLDFLRGDKNFFIEYDLEERCTSEGCIKNLTSKNYLNPYIIIKENDIIKKELITNKFNELLRNELTICKK